MRTIYTFILCFMYVVAFSQRDAAAEGKKHMYEALTLQAPQAIENVKAKLELKPWEALAYIEDDGDHQQEDLQEAVPDYYHFNSGMLDVRLRDPDDASDFSTRMELAYTIGEQYKLLLRKPGGVQTELSWQILYLDKNYLALDMGDVRVFFIHSPIKQ